MLRLTVSNAVVWRFRQLIGRSEGRGRVFRGSWEMLAFGYSGRLKSSEPVSDDCFLCTKFKAVG